MRYGIGRALWPSSTMDASRWIRTTVEHVIRPTTPARKNALFAGSDGGARHWAIAMTLIQTAKLNGVEPLTWLTDVLERIVSGQTKQQQLHTLIPWIWKQSVRATSQLSTTALAA